MRGPGSAVCCGALILATAAAIPAADGDQPPPIQIIFDLHADPFPQVPLDTRADIYVQWRDAARWALGVCAARGARISFLCAGEFAEFALDDPDDGWPLFADMAASGDTIGVHSHKEWQVAPHDWPQLTGTPPPEIVVAAWDDAVGAVDAVVSAALGISDPDELRQIVNSRGSHLPSDDTQRIDLMGDYGFTIHQQGPEEEFFAYFGHYVLNPYRPAGWHFLEHDPAGPVVDSPTGSGLGKAGIHFDIYQDYRLPAAKAHFLLEVLNWLDDAYVAGTGRVWSFGWGLHTADILPGEPQRDAVEPMLDWLKDNFVDTTISGLQVAEFSSSAQSRDRYLEWETAHPGRVPFSYVPRETSWAHYPYLEPVARYLVGAQHVEIIDLPGVRIHRLAASDALGGFPIFVAYPLAAATEAVDVSALFAEPMVGRVCPRTGLAPLVDATDVDIPATGVILVAPDDRLRMPNGDANLDGRVDLTDLAIVLSAYGHCAGDPGFDPDADIVPDGCVDLGDIARLLVFYEVGCP